MATASLTSSTRGRAARRRAPRRRSWLARLLGFFLGTTRFLIATMLFFVLMSLLGYLVVGQYIRGEEVAAPNFIARPLVDAMEMARKANLLLRLDHREPHDTVPVGDIISQQPAPDTMVKTGTPVRVVVSTGSPLIGVPDLKGQSRVIAGMRLRNAGLDVGNVTEIAVAGVAGGLVQATDPPGGAGVPAGVTVRPKVNLLVSSGRSQDAHTMPDLIGLSYKDARVVLAGLGLSMPEERKASAENTLPGQIHAQDPPPGTPVSRTTPISVTYAPEEAGGAGYENVPLTVGPAALGPGFGSGR